MSTTTWEVTVVTQVGDGFEGTRTCTPPSQEAHVTGEAAIAQGTVKRKLVVEKCDIGTLKDSTKRVLVSQMSKSHLVVFNEFLLDEASAGFMNGAVKAIREKLKIEFKVTFVKLMFCGKLSMLRPEYIAGIEIIDVFSLRPDHQVGVLKYLHQHDVRFMNVSLETNRALVPLLGDVIKHIKVLTVMSGRDDYANFLRAMVEKEIPVDSIRNICTLYDDMVPYLRHAKKQILSPTFGSVSADDDFSDETPVYTTEHPMLPGEVHFGRNLTEARVGKLRRHISLLAGNGTVPVFDADIELYEGIEIPVTVQSINRMSVTAVSSPTLVRIVNEMASRKVPVSAWVGLIHEYPKELVEAFNGYYDAIKDLECDFRYRADALDMFVRRITPALKTAIRQGPVWERPQQVRSQVVNISPFCVNMLSDLGNALGPPPVKKLACEYMIERPGDIPNLGVVLWPIHKLIDEGYIEPGYSADEKGFHAHIRLIYMYPYLKMVIHFMAYARKSGLGVLPNDILRAICENYIGCKLQGILQDIRAKWEEEDEDEDVVVVEV